MTYAAHHHEFAPYADAPPATRSYAVAKPKGILRRLFDAIMESRQRETDRQIARFLAQSGGRFSDEIERELMRRVSTSDWNTRR